MSKRFAWLLGVLVLILIGLLLACGSVYNPLSDGLVLVGSQGSALIQTFSFGLSNGHISADANSTQSTGSSTCVLPGIPSSMVLDPAGAYAYVILTQNDTCPKSQTGIAAFKVNSDGTLTATGTITPDPNPMQLVMDSSGKFLFVAEGLVTTSITNSTTETTPCIESNTQYGVCVYAIGSGGSLTAVPGTFNIPGSPSGQAFTPPGPGFQTPNFVAVAATPTVFPALINGVPQAVCSLAPKPTTEYLYAADSTNNVVWEFSVNTSTGALQNPPNTTQVPYFPSPSLPQTGPALSVPSGVAVDACNRFVYVSNSQSNNISAYTICNGSMTQSSSFCPPTPEPPDGSLVAVLGSPYSNASGTINPGPMLVDPFGNTLYVLDTLSNQISTFRIAPVSGSLTPGTPAAVATGLGATSMAIRSDDSWLFVTNFQAATLSQYSITPDTGALTPFPVTSTDNYPWGVAVK
jgi:6-phosphogluconolactonase (cycloisomerase 2 family)